MNGRGAVNGPGAEKQPGGVLPPPLAMHRVGEAALLAEYPGTAEVLAAAAAVRALAPAHLVELVPAERSLLLAGDDARDLPAFAALLRELPADERQNENEEELTLSIVYDGEDLEQAADLLGITSQALITAHGAAEWTAAFGGFAPGFAYLIAEPGCEAAGWDVPRRDEPRSAVPAGAVGLASRYCGIYPRSSPGGWQLIGRSDAALFDPDREPPALLSPGTRVRFAPQRPTARIPAPALTRAAREAAALPGRIGRRRPGAAPAETGRPVLEVLSAGPLSLLEDAGRPGLAAIGVSRSGAFDRGAQHRANRAVGNPGSAAVLETLLGPLRLRALEATVVAVDGAGAPLEVLRADEDGAAPVRSTSALRGTPIALDPGDLLVLGPAEQGLRLVLAVRGGLCAPGGAVLGALSRDTLSQLGPAPFEAGDVLRAGPARGLDAVPAPAGGRHDVLGGDGVPTVDGAPPAGEAPSDEGAPPVEGAAGAPVLEVPVHAGPRDALLGPSALTQLLATTWRVRQDSDRVGVRLEGPPLPLPAGLGTLPSEPMMPGAIQMPPSGLPVVFGPDHPTTGGYPVIAVVTRTGQDRLAQAAPGTSLRFTLPGTDALPG